MEGFGIARSSHFKFYASQNKVPLSLTSLLSACNLVCQTNIFETKVCFNIHLHCFSLDHVTCKVRAQEPIFAHLHCIKLSPFLGNVNFHSCPFLKYNDKVVDQPHRDSEMPTSATGDIATAKLKREKLKGKRAVVRWLKFFRFKKKKEYERMTEEEKILYKLLKVSSVFFCFNFFVCISCISTLSIVLR